MAYLYGFEKLPNFLYDGYGVRVKSGAILMKVNPVETGIENDYEVYVKCNNWEHTYIINLYKFYMNISNVTPPVSEIKAVNMAYWAAMQLHHQTAVAGFKDDDFVYRSACSVVSIVIDMMYDLDKTGKMGHFTISERMEMAEDVKAKGLW